MNLIDEDVLKKTLPFPLYGRYAIVRDIINEIRANDEVFSILEVGGRGVKLSQFLESDNIYYLDPNIVSRDQNLISGDWLSIELEDSSVDWVVSLDIFGHVKEQEREEFLAESIRVSKVGVILTSPFEEPGVHEAEVFVNECFKGANSGRNHVWLREHLESGLPTPLVIEKYLSENGISWRRYNNNQLSVWKYYMGMTIGMNEATLEEQSRKLFEDLHFSYNDRLYKGDNGPQSYRKIYVIEKSSERFSQNSYEPPQSNADSAYDSVFEDTIFLNNRIYEDMLKTQKTSAEVLSTSKSQKIGRLESDLSNILNSRWWKLRNIITRFRNSTGL